MSSISYSCVVYLVQCTVRSRHTGTEVVSSVSRTGTILLQSRHINRWVHIVVIVDKHILCIQQVRNATDRRANLVMHSIVYVMHSIARVIHCIVCGIHSTVCGILSAQPCDASLRIVPPTNLQFSSQTPSSYLGFVFR